MGFCRRCGDIVIGTRCHCGGTAVAGVVQWNKGTDKGPNTDRWSQTYVARESPTQPAGRPPAASGSTEIRRFPRPQSTLGSRVSAHIASTITSRPSSPLKNPPVSSSSSSSPTSAPADIIPSPYTSELSKVYGSVLQPEESLATFHCHVCSSTFPPDATIYPDPTDTTGTRFMCRNCFSENGGSKGNCQECHRPVLILKSEGGFVENAGKVWHKKCFHCAGCGKNVGDKPMVDLLGQPSCADCFDIHLNKTSSPRRHGSPAVTPKKEESSNLGGFRSNASRRQSMEGSPIIEELAEKLGLRSREGTPVKGTTPSKSSPAIGSNRPGSSPLASRLPERSRDEFGPPSISQCRVEVTEEGSPIRRTTHRYSTAEGSPRPATSSPRLSSPKPTAEAVEEMKKRLLREASPQNLRETFSLASSANTTPRTTPRASTRHSITTSDTPTPPAMSRIPVRSSRTSDIPLLRHRESDSSMRMDVGSMVSISSSIPSTPSLMSDFSDTTTQSSAPSSPPSYSPPSESSYRDDDVFSSSGRSAVSDASDRYSVATNFTAEPHKSLDSYARRPHAPKLPPLSLSVSGPAPDAKCAKCSLALFDIKSGGQYVTVPEPSSSGSPSKTYHTECFRCRICNGIFEQEGKGQAVFVRGVRGVCHLDCAPAEKVTIRRITSTSYPPTPTIATSTSTRSHAPSKSSSSVSSHASSGSPGMPYVSSRYTAPLQSAASTLPRFGGSASCPGCHLAVSQMERGVVPGPHGTRWHSSCLICGGRTAKGRNGRRRDGKPGCGKSLDSSAKRDAEEGNVWCKECLLLLPLTSRSLPQTSPTRASPLKPTHTGSSSRSSGPFSRVTPQYTGTTTIARQFTGLSGGVDAALARQLTGGGLSPTRQLAGSPAKGIGRQYTGGSTAGGTVRPRPKSVIGMRDEGRGMFLVRQMTGGGGQ